MPNQAPAHAREFLIPTFRACARGRKLFFGFGAFLRTTAKGRPLAPKDLEPVSLGRLFFLVSPKDILPCQ